MERLTLRGTYVRLEPLDPCHVDALAAAGAEDRSFYQWTFVPANRLEAAKYIASALAMEEAGKATPFAIIRAVDDAVIGSTRFWNLDQWPWPADHPRHNARVFDCCEIGHTWFSAPAMRTAANTESKLLMLTHAFESWKVLSVCLHTDVRNQRSRAAIERIGGKFEGILRSHRMAADHTSRDSARFSIVAAGGPAVNRRLSARLYQS